MPEILNGKLVAKALKENLRQRLEILSERGITPGIALIRVGEDPASEVYVRSKDRPCRKLGIRSQPVALPADVTQSDLMDQIHALNRDSTVHGILVQLPLPAHLSEDAVIEAISSGKDVDGFHPVSAGLISLGIPRFIPATPLGIIRILQHYNIETSGKNIVIIGRSRIVGRPLANLLSAKASYGNATVTVCHTRTKKLAEISRSADILIAAAGIKGIVTADMVTPEMIVIDVGIHRDPDPERPGKSIISGDVDYSAVVDIVKAITPVPGGVGPMTVACLLENTVFAAEQCD